MFRGTHTVNTSRRAVRAAGEFRPIRSHEQHVTVQTTKRLQQSFHRLQNQTRTAVNGGARLTFNGEKEELDEFKSGFSLQGISELRKTIMMLFFEPNFPPLSIDLLIIFSWKLNYGDANKSRTHKDSAYCDRKQRKACSLFVPHIEYTQR